MPLSPRLKAAYLAAVAGAGLAGSDPLFLGLLAAIQAGLWLGNGLGFSEFFGLFRRLWLFGLVLVLSCGWLPPSGAPPESWTLGGFDTRLNLAGLAAAGAMLLRLAAVLGASALVQRTSEPGELVTGLRAWGMPELLAMTLEGTLELLRGAERRPGSGGGRGTGGGRGGGRRHEEPGGELAALSSFRELARGETRPVVEAVERQLERYVPPEAAGDSPARRDAAVLAALAALMLGTKLLKVLPGVPFAPGYKTVFLIPLYILAAATTRTRFGATIVGSTVGLVSFLYGDGRFGIFEIFKHVAPGLVVDAVYPRGGAVGPAACAVLGGAAALARTTTMLAVVAFVEGNAALYALAGFQAVSQLAFGVLSGLVTAPLLKALSGRFGPPPGPS